MLTARFLQDVVDVVRESGDIIQPTVAMPEPKRGEILAVCTTGAYNYSMASNYNSRGRAAEVLVSGSRVWLIRRRETIEDLMALENTVPTDAFV